MSFVDESGNHITFIIQWQERLPHPSTACPLITEGVKEKCGYQAMDQPELKALLLSPS